MKYEVFYLALAVAFVHCHEDGISMSVAGLRQTPMAGNRVFLLRLDVNRMYNGAPAYFNDWEFRTLLRLKLYQILNGNYRMEPTGSRTLLAYRKQ